ncbi:MAG: hypothetical protein ACLT9P_06985 [Evtepia gabavorous]
MMFYLLSMAAALARNAKPEAPPACAQPAPAARAAPPMGTQGGQPRRHGTGHTPDQPQ